MLLRFLRSLRFLVLPFFVITGATAASTATIACSTDGIGDCRCRLDPKHPDSGIVTCEGTVGGGQPEQCKLEDEATKKPQSQSEISVACDDPDPDTDSADCEIVE